MRNLQEQVKKAFCYQKLFWPFTVWINCSSDLKKFSNSRPSASNFKSFSRSLEHFFLAVGQNNLGNKLPFSLYTFEYFFIYEWPFLKTTGWDSPPSYFAEDCNAITYVGFRKLFLTPIGLCLYGWWTFPDA